VPPRTSPTPLSLATLVGLVVASMVGTGVFTSIGHQLASIRQGGVNLSLWVLGTLVVMALYVGLNAVFLRAVPAGLMAGRTEGGLIAATRILGPGPGAWMAGALALVLVSTLSATVWIGPRVIQVMGEDHPFFGWLASRTAQGVPARAMVLQSGASMLLLATGAYDRVLVYAQFALLACTLLAAAGVVVLRFTEPDLPRPHRAWGYPATPIAYLAVTLWMMVYVVLHRPVEALLGTATLALGFLLNGVAQRMAVAVKDQSLSR
jgi:basic amino acid/polyamine antiporter, APA family